MKIEYSKEFLEDLEKLCSDDWRYSIPRFFNDLKLSIRWGWQRLTRGFDDHWYWSFHTQMTDQTLKCMKKLKEINQVDPNWKPHAPKYDLTYNQFLDKIIAGFEAAKEIDDDAYFVEGKIDMKKYKQLEKQFAEGMKYFTVFYFNLWD